MVHYCQLCGIEADKFCSACKLVFYCSEACQKLHWKNGHKKYCGVFTVAECVGGHKCLQALKNIERGTVILIEFPIFHAPLIMKAEPGAVLSKRNYLICVTCSKNLAGFNSIRCNLCKWPCCSQECAEHKSHSDYECEILASKKIDYDSLKPTDESSLLLSLRGLQLKNKNPGLWKELLYCCPFQVDNEKQKVKRILKKLQLYDPDAFNVALTCVNSAKGFCISDYDMQPCTKANGQIGLPDKVNIFFFQNASYLLQSCSPNTTWWVTDFPDCKITLRSNRPIKAGEILYIKSAVQNERSIRNLDILKDGTMQRRLHIHTLTTRICLCERCSDETEFGTYFSAMACLPCQNELEIERSKNKNASDIDPNLGYYLLANPIPSDDEWAVKNRQNIPWKCNRCQQIKPYSQFALELSSFASLIISPDVQTVSQLRNLIEGNKTLHPNHYMIIHGKLLLLEVENKKFGDFSRFPYKMQRKNSREIKIQYCRHVLQTSDQVLNGSWTSRRAHVAAELADSLIKNYSETLDELDEEELETLLAEVDEGIKLFEEAIFISTNIEPANQNLRSQVPGFQQKIKEGQDLKAQIQNHLSQKYCYTNEESIESLHIS